MSKIQVLDYYVPLASEAYASSKVLLELGQDHVLFYVAATTRELRVRAYGSNRTHVLMQGVAHCHGYAHDGMAYIYVALNAGGIRLLTYRYFGELSPASVAVAMGYNAVYLHAIRQGDRHLMIIDTGGKLMLLSAEDAAYLTRFQIQQVYSNLRDTVYRMSKPVIEIHPDNFKVRPTPSQVTIAVERLTLATQARDVGFFVVETIL